MDCECFAHNNMTTQHLHEQVNDSAEFLMATYEWNDLAMHGAMKSVIKNHLRMMNDSYIRMLKQKKQSLMDEILDKIQHSSLSVGGDVPINMYKNGGCYSIIGVIVSDSFGNKFKFDSDPASNEYSQQTGYTSKWFSIPNNLKYIPSYLWPQEDDVNS